jgi:hypothetical protein
MRFLRSCLRLPVKLSLGTALLLKALALEERLPVAHLVKRAMHAHWQEALATLHVRSRPRIARQLIVLKLRPALAERVRLAVNRNRSALVEHCCLLYLRSYRYTPGQASERNEQQDERNPDRLASS